MNEWHTQTIEEIENSLRSSAEKGITVSEARKRLDFEKGKSKSRFSLFVKRKKHPVKAFFSLLLSPLILMTFATALLSVVFGGFLPGVCVLCILLITSAVIGVLLLKSQKHLDAMNEYSSPMIRVLREGKTYHTDGRNAVCGDIVSFTKGDIIVADIRLISSDGLKVKELYNTKQGIRNRIVQKDSAITYAPDETRSPDAQNMLYAGSAVIEGEGIGIVVNTAKDVYLAKYAPEGSLNLQKSDSTEIKKLSRSFRMAYIISIIVICILSLVSLLTLKEIPFIANFLLIISSLCAVSIEIIDLIRQRQVAFSMALLFKSATAEADSSAVLRGENTLEVLNDVTDLILLGDAAFSSGALQVGEIYSAGERFSTLSQSNIIGSRILGCIDSYIRAQRDSGLTDEISNEGITESLLGFLRTSEFDFGAALLTTVSLYYKPDKPGKTGHACVETNKGEYRVTLTLDREILSHCSCVRTPDGMDREMYRFFADGIEEFMCEKGDNTKFVFVVTEYAGEAVLEAIVSLSQVASNEVIPSLQALKKTGIKTKIFSFEEKSLEAYDPRIFDLLGDLKIAYASKFKESGKEITDSIDEYCAYFGFSSDEYTSLLSKMRSNGARIATYGVNDAYYDVMAESDIAISCDILNYSSDKHKESVYERIMPDGRESSLRTSQRMRLLSNVIVRRTHKRGGGLSSIVNAIANAKNSMPNIALSVLFVSLILSLILPFTLISVLSGVSLVNAPNVALTVCYALSLIFIVFPHCMPKSDSICDKSAKGESIIISYLKNALPMLIASSSFAVVVSLVVIILEIIGVFGKTSGYTFAMHFGVLLAIGCETLFFMKKHFIKMSGSSKLKTGILFGSTYLLSIIVLAVAILDSKSISNVGAFEFLIIPLIIILYFLSKFVLLIVLKRSYKEKK